MTCVAASSLDVDEAVADAARLNSVDGYDILDTPPEPQFDRIASLICRLFSLPMGVVSIIDAHRQWYKAASGMPVREAYAPYTICRHSLVDGKPLIVPDAREDVRFANSPLVLAQPHIRFCASVPLRAHDGQWIGTVCGLDIKPRQFTPHQTLMFQDIAKIAMDALEMRRLAETDILTGALTRRAFLEVAETAIVRAKRNRQDLICVMFEIDNFKDIILKYGHAAANEVLRTVGEICRAGMSEVDHFGRISGAEFVVLLEQADTQAAFVVAEKLRRVVARTPVTIGSNELHITISSGSAQASTSGQGVEGLMAVADTKLYEAIKAGRNCTRTGPVAGPNLRRRGVKAGRIILNGGREMLDCTVTSRSRTSAGFEVISASAVPPQFKLAINGEEREAYCHIVAHTDTHVDVELM